MPPKKSPAAPTTPRWQNIATVLIILHLFCLAIGVAVNAGGGKSMIGQSLRRVPIAREYLQFLLMDMAYDFQLAGAEPDDGVHRLQLLRGDLPATDPAAVLATLPDDAVEPRIRRQRYQQLAFHVSYFDDLFEENSDLRTQLPLAIAERWIKGEALPQAPYVLNCLRMPSKRLPRAVAADITYAYVMREGGLRQQAIEKPPPDPIAIFLVWDPIESRYQGARETPLGQRAEVVSAAASPPRGEAANETVERDSDAAPPANPEESDSLP